METRVGKRNRVQWLEGILQNQFHPDCIHLNNNLENSVGSSMAEKHNFSYMYVCHSDRYDLLHSQSPTQAERVCHKKNDQIQEQRETLSPISISSYCFFTMNC